MGQRMEGFCVVAGAACDATVVEQEGQEARNAVRRRFRAFLIVFTIGCGETERVQTRLALTARRS